MKKLLIGSIAALVLAGTSLPAQAWSSWGSPWYGSVGYSWPSVANWSYPSYGYGSIVPASTLGSSATYSYPYYGGYGYGYGSSYPTIVPASTLGSYGNVGYGGYGGYGYSYGWPSSGCCKPRCGSYWNSCGGWRY